MLCSLDFQFFIFRTIRTMMSSNIRCRTHFSVCDMLCAICYRLYNSKKLKNTHGGVLLLVKLQKAEDIVKGNIIRKINIILNPSSFLFTKLLQLIKNLVWWVYYLLLFWRSALRQSKIINIIRGGSRTAATSKM